MGWYAVDSIDDALEATSEFLFPFALRRWARLALLTLFIGGGGVSLGTFQNIAQLGSTSNGTGSGLGNLQHSVISVVPLETTPALLLSQLAPPPVGLSEAVLVAILVGVAIAGLGLGIIGAVFEFVFVGALVTDKVRIIRTSRDYLWQALRYFAFQVGIAILAFGPLIVIGIIIQMANINIERVGFLGIFLLGLLLAVPYLFVARFTREFVIPIMIETGSGVVTGWRRLGRRLRREWKQFGMYLVLHFFVRLGAGIARGLTALFGALLIGIVAIVVGIGIGFVIETGVGGAASGTGIEIGLLIAAVVGGLAFFVLIALPLNVLVQTYLRNYELICLNGFDEPAPALSPSIDGSAGGTESESGNPPEAQKQSERSRETEHESGDPAAGSSDSDNPFQEFVPAPDRTDGEQDEPN